ncbi:MAG: Do family serine endopeptidase, partial [Pseudomonadota bacterium]
MSVKYSGFRPGFQLLGKVAALLCGTVVAVTVSAQSLPDFTVLVEQNAPAIVNVSTTYAAVESNPQQRQELEDLLRYYFGDRAPQLQLPNPDEQPQEEGGATGSGFIIDSSGYIVTNHHVIDEARTIKVTLNDQREYSATVVGSDERSDLAVLKIEATNLPTVKLGESEKLKVGEWVLAIGSPFGLQYSVAAGIISYMGRSLPTEGSNYVSYIQTDVAINPGHSGGPLFNMAGEVIGINSQIFTSTGGSIGLSFAIPVDVAKNVVAQLRDSGTVQRGWMGVGIDNVSQDLADAFNLDRPHGALVNDVIKGGPAEAAGFATGDVIVEFNGHDVRTRDDLPYFVGLLKPGTSVPVEIVRNGNPQSLTMTVGDLDKANQVTQNTPAIEAESRLGLKVSSLDAKVREDLDLDSGIVVDSVTGPAQEARLQPGDIIVSLNGVELNAPADLAALELTLPIDRPLPVLVVREQRQTFF